MAIHATAVVHETAEIHSDVDIGAYAIIEGNVRIGAGTRIFPHAFVGRYTTLGQRCEVHPFAVVGHVPQDLSFDGSVTYTRIGDETVIREGASVHRAAGSDATTVVGNRCLIMSTAHVGHDCILGDDVKMANGVLLAGHVHVQDKVFFGGNSGVHQFVRIGELSMVGGGLRITGDVLPFMMDGPDGIVGPNVIGMRRAGLTTEERQEIRQCHRLLYRSEHTFTKAIEVIAETVQTEPGRKLADFLRGPSKRGFMGFKLRSKHGENRKGDS